MAVPAVVAAASKLLMRVTVSGHGAQRELDELNAAFKIEIKDAHFFLGNNINVMTQDGAP